MIIRTSVFFSFFISNGWRFKQATHPILRILVVADSFISNYRLSRIENLDGYLTTGDRILWKRGEIVPKESISPLFHNIFNISLQKSVYIFICEMWLFDLFFPQFCKCDISRYEYIKVFQRVPWISR